MAIWQYNLHIIPKEEILSYFEYVETITDNDLNEIEWWRYRKLNIKDFDIFKDKLIPKKSWSSDIVLLGDEDSNCIIILMEFNKVAEISVRIDLRSDFRFFLQTICDFAEKHNCIFLNYELRILEANYYIMKHDIIVYPLFKSFIDKIK